MFFVSSKPRLYHDVSSARLGPESSMRTCHALLLENLHSQLSCLISRAVLQSAFCKVRLNDCFEDWVGAYSGLQGFYAV
jgi:hypothetical protein